MLEWWEALRKGGGGGLPTALQIYLPRFEASLTGLNVAGIYWWTQSHGSAKMVLCGDGGFAKIEISMTETSPPDNTWSHTVRFTVIPWSEVTEITQRFVLHGRRGEHKELELSVAALTLRDGTKLSLLPEIGAIKSGGARVIPKLESHNDVALFVADLVKAHGSR